MVSIMHKVSAEFHVPPHLHASVPLEMKGLSRDSARMMVVNRTTGKAVHTLFTSLGDYLQAGDVVVLNNSRTIPAVLKGKQGENQLEIRLSRKVKANQWDVLVIGEYCHKGGPISFIEGVQGEMVGSGSENPLMRMKFSVHGTEFYDFLYKAGEPVRYEYIQTSWALDMYQTVYGSVPGSVEMASAGRAFSWKLLQSLKEKGIRIAFVQLHSGLSYYGDDRWPAPLNHPEEFFVPEETAVMVQQAKKKGNRVIAVGTTVVRALESAVTEKGELQAMNGITDLYITKESSLKVVDCLLTGLHEPEASHMHLLTAFIPEDLLLNSYQQALLEGYHWHEFGDVNLILN